MNSLPKKAGVHIVLLSKEIITALPLWVPPTTIFQYIKGHIRGFNDTDQERSIDRLYICRAENGSSHKVFKLRTNQAILVNRKNKVPMTADFIESINEMGQQDDQSKWIEFFTIIM